MTPAPPASFPAINRFLLPAGKILHRIHGRAFAPDSGIVKKLKKGQDISVMASWKRHIQIKQAGSLAATVTGRNY